MGLNLTRSVTTSKFSSKFQRGVLLRQSVRFHRIEEDDKVGCVDLKSKMRTSALPLPLYGGRYLVTMMPGSGIGPELTEHVQRVYEAANAPVDFETYHIVKPKDAEESMEMLTQAVLSIERNRVAIKGNLRDEHLVTPEPNSYVRAALDLFAYYVHYKSYPDVKARFPNIDIVVVRQNTEGEYLELEHQTVEGIVESLKVTTEYNSRRIAKWAFEFAKNNKREKITALHVARYFELSDGLFLSVAKEVAKGYPEIMFDDMRVDRFSAKLVRDPSRFDVLLMSNLYGNIVSNMICGLCGGPGLFAGINCGPEAMIFETATRVLGQDLVGKNVANPIGMLKGSVSLLMQMGRDKHARIIMDAISDVLHVKKLRTPDLGGTHTSTDIVDAVIKYIDQNAKKQLLY